MSTLMPQIPSQLQPTSVHTHTCMVEMEVGQTESSLVFLNIRISPSSVDMWNSQTYT